MNGCIGAMPTGLQKACGGDWKKVDNVYFVKVGTTWADRLEAVSLAKWREYITQQDSAGELRVWGGKIINSYEITTADPTEVVFDSGKKRQTDLPKPSLSIMMDVNECDASMLFNTIDGGTYGVVFELLDGTLVFEKLSSGLYQGQEAKCYLKTKGVNQPADVGNNVKIDVYFETYESALKTRLLKPEGWKLKDEILESSPIGLNFEQDSEYNTATGIVTVQVDTRCIGGRTGLTTAEVVIKNSNRLDTPAITTVVDNGFGSYDLTLQKVAIPVNLEVGDFMTLQIQVIDAGIVKEISNEITIIAKS